MNFPIIWKRTRKHVTFPELESLTTWGSNYTWLRKEQVDLREFRLQFFLFLLHFHIKSVLTKISI